MHLLHAILYAGPEILMEVKEFVFLGFVYYHVFFWTTSTSKASLILVHSSTVDVDIPLRSTHDGIRGYYIGKILFHDGVYLGYEITLGY